MVYHSELHYKKWLVLPSIDHGKLELLHTGIMRKTTVQNGKTTLNIICGCFTMLVNLYTSFHVHQCAEALVCSDQNLVKQDDAKICIT